MTKDRLADLVSVQSGNNGTTTSGDEVSVNIINSPYDDTMQDFLAESAELRQMIESIETSVEEVKLKHSDILSAPHTDDKLKNKLEDLTDSIKRTANKARLKLKTMEQNIETDERKGASAMKANLRIRKTQHSALTRMFVDVMMDYNRTQSEHRDRCKARLQRQLEITGKATTDDELDEMLEQGNPAVFTQGIIMETQQARQTCADIEARHADIVKLENSIKELHDMFIDMAVLVEGQGQLVDSIEYHVSKTTSFVCDGTNHLKSGKRAQSKARRKRIYLAICLLVGLIIIFALVFGIKPW